VPKKCNQPTLVQKPFKYPCDGGLYFTREKNIQVLLSGFLTKKNDVIVGRIVNDITEKPNYFNLNGKCGEFRHGGKFNMCNPDNDLISTSHCCFLDASQRMINLCGIVA